MNKFVKQISFVPFVATAAKNLLVSPFVTTLKCFVEENPVKIGGNPNYRQTLQKETMSTLPFLLSVADELDNLNSQSYMDDFGLGFHPHRQYYRTPTIQLSLPAGTEWMQPEGRHHSRYRSTYRYYGEPQNNLTSPAENDEEDNEEQHYDSSTTTTKDSRDNGKSGMATSSSSAQKFVSALNSNRPNDGSDSIDNSMQLYNLSKKCGKNYYRHPEPCTSSASLTKPPPLPPRSATSIANAANAAAAAAASTSSAKEKTSMSYRLHSKCLEGNNSSSEESLQKVTSSIEFLTCFLLKKSRVSKTSSPGSAAAAAAAAAEGKKS